MISSKVHILADLRKFLDDSSANKSKYTTHEGAFTKPKKLTFILTVLFLLNLPRKSLGIEIESFFKVIDKELATCTKSAMSQARYKLKKEIFIDWNIALQQSYYKHNEKSIKRWGKYRLEGIDGSTAHLMDTEEIRKEFGCQPNQHGGEPMARILARVDVLNEIIIDGQIGPISKGEKEMAVSYLDQVGENVISIYDRNFASFAFIYEHDLRDLPFIIRCKVGFNNVVKEFVSSGEESAIVKFYATNNAVQYFAAKGIKLEKQDFVKVRLVRVELSSGETEILITSLKDEQEFPTHEFGEIYNTRWGTEICFDTLKNKFQITAFSGHTPMAIYQDFHATVLVANINTILIQDCEEEVEKISEHRQHDYKINKNISIGSMKGDLVKLFLEEDKQVELLLKVMKARFIRHVEPVRPGRSFERRFKTRARRTKYYTLTNYRRAI